LVHHKKTAFLKFFFTYFISVALLILVSGFFYLQEMKSQLIKSQHFSLIEYARTIKMGGDMSRFSNDFHNKLVFKNERLDIRNFSQVENEFIKYIPTKMDNRYLKVFKSKTSFIEAMKKLKLKILFTQLFLLLIFAIISYILAKNALKPLNESIETLDKFAKDLIHDLNTPITAMGLNIKLLEKQECNKNSKPFIRLKKSINVISELRETLTTLLEKKTFQVCKTDICTIVKDVVELHQVNYPTLSYKVNCSSFEVEINSNAMKQILQNIISNASKYNKKNGYVKIYSKNKTLYIEDSGVGIVDTTEIFNREYSKQNSTGLGLDIVKRLAQEMNIKVEVTSNKNGSCFKLNF